MNDKLKNQITSDLLPAIADAGVFAVLMHLVAPLIAAVLAIASYCGIRMIMPAPMPTPVPEDALDTAGAAIEALRRVVLTPPTVQARLNQVIQAAAALATIFEQDRSANVDGQIMLQQYLSMLQGVLNRYRKGARLSAGAGRQSVESISQLLDGLATRFNTLNEKLVHQEDAEISSEIKALNQALAEIDPLTDKVRGDHS